MPLPDERPRQSVQNLIGRFEQQTKRQSLTGSPTPFLPPRTSSVASHHTGDSAKEELKEKREWPPKAKSTSPPASTVDVTEQPQQHDEPAAQSPQSEAAPAPPDPTPEVPVAEPTPSPPETAVPVPVPKPEPARQGSVGSVAAPTPKRAGNLPSKPATASSRTGAPAATGVRAPTRPRTANKSPPSSFHGAPAPSTSTSNSASTPARVPSKPSSTSVAAASPSKARPATRNPPTASVPPRSKTPSLRPKTPTAAPPARPKTPSGRAPSSGLFAPTAASLARARNAGAPPVPAPVRKASSGPSVSDRLSKPTAASLNRAVSPPRTVAHSSPARGAARGAVRGAARGAAPARGTTTKTRGSATAAAKAKPAASATAAAPAIAVAIEPAQGEPAEEDQQAHTEEPETLASPVEHVEHVEHEPEGSDSTLIDEPQHVSTGLTQEPGVHDAAVDTAVDILNTKQEALEAAVAAAEQGKTELHETEAHDEAAEELPPASEPEHLYEKLAPVELEEAVPAASELAEEHDAHVEHIEEAHESETTEVNGKATPTPAGHDNELVDLINTLERKPRPVSMMTIPDEVIDIPDEE
ncbi:hypothetical protein WOLCODRAFT_137696 [Wolfiporia cocos MD-104 SS10]|uniref:Uncharacterized protein n=1 Tax=Wolfiporia cocos (strain MD-104) TaxID=742152 RepID=A0A2H3JIT0_WOLCO|nr:hypothetical protein WOLCODRAFT_137696 [Wolfiporia cocos MD-104 SS10]